MKKAIDFRLPILLESKNNGTSLEKFHDFEQLWMFEDIHSAFLWKPRIILINQPVQ